LLRFLKKVLGISRGAGSSEEGQRLTGDLDRDVRTLRGLLENCADVVFRPLVLGPRREFRAMVITAEGLVDKDLIDDHVIRPLVVELAKEDVWRRVKGAPPRELITMAIPFVDVKTEAVVSQVITQLFKGNGVLLVNGVDSAFIVGTPGQGLRSIDEPKVETAIRGPHDGFIENLRQNVSLVRRRIRHPSLKVELISVGERSQQDVAVLYVDGVVDPKLVEEVRSRLKCITIDAILDAGYIEQLIEDDWLSPFPQLLMTERPDKVTSAILEGRVAVLVDHSPGALIIPGTLDSFFHAPEDHYSRWFASSVIRSVRFIGTFLALVTPGVYVAVTSFHPDLVSSSLILSVAATRERVPFPAVVEAFFMLATLELLREAGIRLPAPIGQTIGIVGALVIGQAAVAAGIVSSIMVVIIAFTAISSFTMPSYEMGLAFRFFAPWVLISAGILGLYGLVMAMLFILTHLSSLKSFGVSYLAPWAPRRTGALLRDTLVRSPLVYQSSRPGFLKPQDRRRMVDERRDSQE